MSWLFPVAWHANHRVVACPYCTTEAVVPRRPTDERVVCRACGRPFRVVPAGAAVPDRDPRGRGRRRR